MKALITVFKILIIILLTSVCSARRGIDENSKNQMKEPKGNNYGEDKSFLGNYCDLIELSSGKSKVLLSAKFQGRVFTSSATRDGGLSFGWINYDLFRSGMISEQFNPYGGEERLWLGPEGGPFSVYFENGKEQTFENWKVPEVIDTDKFDVVEQNCRSVSFRKEFFLKNYSGFLLDIGIERNVRLLSTDEIETALTCPVDSSLAYVAYESENILINNGSSAWNSSGRLLSVWMLSMFNPSPSGVVFIPYKEGPESELGKIVTDDYFGKVPEERLSIRNGTIFFKADGKYRSKIGISPKRVLPFCGSYDGQKQVLTVLWFSSPDEPSEYLNSIWGKQENPMAGDVVNSYNDGPVKDGSVMGPFYEIESSSPAAFLAPGGKIVHTQRIFHITGDKKRLNIITRKIFNLSVSDIEQAFK